MKIYIILKIYNIDTQYYQWRTRYQVKNFLCKEKWTSFNILLQIALLYNFFYTYLSYFIVSIICIKLKYVNKVLRNRWDKYCLSFSYISSHTCGYSYCIFFKLRIQFSEKIWYFMSNIQWWSSMRNSAAVSSGYRSTIGCISRFGNSMKEQEFSYKTYKIIDGGQYMS